MNINFGTCLLAFVCALCLACGPKSAGDDTEGASTTSGSTSGGTTVVVVTAPTSPTEGDHACGSLLSNNDENCVCLPGYERCDPGDPLDTDCCETPGGGVCPDPNSTLDNGLCYCDPGYSWCVPDDPDDLSCCADPGPTTTGTTGGGESCPAAVQPPRSCDPDTENFFCTHPEACGPAGSALYVCEAGAWVPAPDLGEQSCQLDGYDFTYGCVDTGTVEILCGIGPGTPCDADAPSLCEFGALYSCVWGKRTVTDCFAQCTEIGDENQVLYDFGHCDFVRGEPACICCDMGDPGCPV